MTLGQGMRIRSIAARLVLIVMALPLNAHAMEFIYDAKVFAFLPEWCKYTPIFQSSAPGGGNDVREEVARLNAIMGPLNFRHLHHYCAGLIRTARALYFEKTKAARDVELAQSLGEYDYAIS